MPPLLHSLLYHNYNETYYKIIQNRITLPKKRKSYSISHGVICPFNVTTIFDSSLSLTLLIRFELGGPITTDSLIGERSFSNFSALTPYAA